LATVVNTAAEAIKLIQSDQQIWVHSMAATPSLLLEALVEHAAQLTNVSLLQLHLENAEMLTASYAKGHLRARCFFASHATRHMINQGTADYIPMMLSDIPRSMRTGEQPVDVALIQVSPPDKHGLCSLGVSVEASRAACESASTIIAHVNPQMPRSHGDGFIHWREIDLAFEKSVPLPVVRPPPADEITQRIAQHAAELIGDRDCLQLGIGAIPDAIMSKLTHLKDIGIHSEMFSDGVVDLVEQGVITNHFKSTHAGTLVAGFVMGSRRVYDFIDDNPEVVLLDIEYVNSLNSISRNKQVVSVNSALQIDLSGQVCADSIGSDIYSGVGGQLDFVLGANLSENGRSIIALPSTAAGGSISRIVPVLTSGAGVVTPRANVHHIVTEFGVATLRGKSLIERARALINVAHPDFREELERWLKAAFPG
jgi:acyl-CoA hydrolase